MKQNNRGFSLVEIVVAMAILGIFSLSICTSLVMSLRMNAKTEALMQEQLAVSSAVETLMASGVTTIGEDTTTFEHVKVTTSGSETDPYLQVTFESKGENKITVSTYIRRVVSE